MNFHQSYNTGKTGQLISINKRSGPASHTGTAVQRVFFQEQVMINAEDTMRHNTL